MVKALRWTHFNLVLDNFFFFRWVIPGLFFYFYIFKTIFDAIDRKLLWLDYFHVFIGHEFAQSGHSFKPCFWVNFFLSSFLMGHPRPLFVIFRRILPNSSI